MGPMGPMGPMRPMGLMGLMGLMRPMGPMGLMCLGLLGLLCLGLLGCSEDEAGDDGRRVTFEAQSCATVLDEEGQGSESRLFTTRDGDSSTWTVPSFTTRDGESTPPTWTPPSSYVTYDALNNMFLQQKNLVHKSISVFFTQNGQTPWKDTFFYKEYDKSWRIKTGIENAGTYYLYGYIPEEDAASATIVSYDGSAAAGDSHYEDGAVLTINGLNAVTPSDVCVIIGAKNGRGLADDTGDNGSGASDGNHIKAGEFAVDAKATGSIDSPSGQHNYIFLLFDHLYSSLRFRFTVEAKYAALRTIKLRKLELTSYTNAGGGVRAKYNATITLKKNTTGASPIVGSVSFTPDDTSPYVSQVPLFEGEVTLPVYPTVPSEFMGCFVPGDYTKFKLRSTYDVYDKNQAKDKNGVPVVDSNGDPVYNLIRQGCQAENIFDLKDKFGSSIEVTRGHCYTYTITVQPTYLYMLSDPDLDNPTVTVN